MRTLLFCLLALSTSLACTSSTPDAKDAAPARPITVPAPARTAPTPTDFPGVHNVVAYGDGLYSGSVPEGSAGFETLAGMGVQTIISVDGAEPDVEAAKARGMRYVHLPIGYNGMSAERRLEIARAIQDLPGPIYLHCHHGKHRSAGAAAGAAITLGRLSNDEALARMKVSGTAPNYKGLYACATDTHPATGAQIASASNAFPSVWKTSGFVETMVEVDETMDRLKAIEKAGFMAPLDHPDLVPVAEAGKLADLLRLVGDEPEAKKRSDEFREWLLASSKIAEKLEKGFAANAPAAENAAEMKRLAQSCKDCHVKYRD